MPIQSMESLYNIARNKQQIKENEYNPWTGMAGAMLEGTAAGLQKREERPAQEAELFLKLLDIQQKQEEIKKQELINKQNQEMHQKLFGNLNADKQRVVTDDSGNPVHSPGSYIEKLWKTHDINVKYDPAKGFSGFEMKPKKTEKTQEQELDLYTQKKKIDYELKRKYGTVDANAIALEINRLADPYRDFGKEVNWTKMQTENPKLYKTIQMLYDMHSKIRNEQFNPENPLGISDLDLEE